MNIHPCLDNVDLQTCWIQASLTFLLKSCSRTHTCRVLACTLPSSYSLKLFQCIPLGVECFYFASTGAFRGEERGRQCSSRDEGRAAEAIQARVVSLESLGPLHVSNLRYIARHHPPRCISVTNTCNVLEFKQLLKGVADERSIPDFFTKLSTAVR